MKHVKEAAGIVGTILLSLMVLMGFAAWQFPVYMYKEVLPWVFLSYLWGSMSSLGYMLYTCRPKPRPRRPLDDFAGQVVQEDLPDEYTVRH
jgi:hypothetical protein